MNTKKLFSLLIVLTLFIQCKTQNIELYKNLKSNIENNQYFELASRLKKNSSELNDKERLYLKAHSDNAFNDIESSQNCINTLLEKYNNKLTVNEKANLLQVQFRNYIRLSEYEKTYNTINKLLGKYKNVLDSVEISHYENSIKHFSLLKKLKPQTVIKSNHNVEINSFRNKVLNFVMIPVKLDSYEDNFLFDTGAEMSVITNTTAKKLGLKVLKTEIPVETSTGEMIKANIAIAESLLIGNIELKNVVFVVMSLPSIPALDFYCHGILGMPEIMKLGEITLRKDGTMLLSNKPNAETEKNIFFSSLDGLSPIVNLKNNDAKLKLVFDTGANVSDLSVNYFNKFKEQIKLKGKKRKTEVSGVSDKQEMAIYELPNFSFNISGVEKKIKNIEIYTEKLYDFHFDGTIGEDMLMESDEIIMNFKDMYIIAK